jgi:transcriptional regulator with XRE-family HTH domain/Zn-dependent peptidase ImmA (M78 family)
MKEDAESLAQVGENIRALRRRRRMSQTELARRLGMRPGPVNCIEKGRNLPSARVLHRLSEILQAPIDAFFAASPARYFETASEALSDDGASDATLPLRACARPARTREEQDELPEKLLAMTTRLADAFLALEDLGGAPKSALLALIMPFERTEAGLIGLCDRVRRMLGVNEAVIFDVVELLENAGLRLVFAPLPDGQQSVSFHDVANGNAFLFVSCADGMNAERQLFRLCYELGRLYAHAPGRADGVAVPGCDRRGKPFAPDRLARRFAALFLMPESAVRASVAQTGVRPDGWSLALLYRLKHRFGVSAETFLYRLDELDLIAPLLRKRFQRAILAHYRAHDHGEPDATRRILSPNGRLGDLLHVAEQRLPGDEEVARTRAALKSDGLPGLEAL